MDLKPAAATLVVFCRRPESGVGKRRIAADLGDPATVELGEHLLATTLEDVDDWPGEVVLAPSRCQDASWAAGLLDRPCRVVPQPDGNLGERLLAVDRDVRATGVGRVFFIGSDAPLLDAEYFEAARNALEDRDVVLGPASDGGVTLMGSREPWPSALAGLPWSTEALGGALEEACLAAGYTVAHLDERSDVDQLADLAPLVAALEGDARPARARLRIWLGGRSEVVPTISIVVPVLGDVPELHRLLDLVGAGMDPGVETIVVDGQGDPACRELCRARHCVYIEARPGRGYQLRLGAEAARGPLLWFLHADAEPPIEAVERIRRVVRDGAVGGYFRFRFAGPRTWTKEILERLVALRNRAGGVPYGDQGLFFTRQAYEAAGGFAAQPLFEEVPLVRGARRFGSFVALQDAIGVSARRWERDGWIRRTLENRALAVGHALGIPPRILARRYHPTPKGSPGRGDCGGEEP